MIDWLTARFPCAHETAIHGDRLISITPGGELQWEAKKRHVLRGSHESKIFVRTYDANDGTRYLEVDGNPSKFFQGHNLFGTDDLVGLGGELMERLCLLLPLAPTQKDRSAWWAGDFILNRVDCTRMYALKDDKEALAWIRSAEYSAHMTRMGKGVLTGSTLYFGKKSRRWSIKFYCKGPELDAKGHSLPGGLYYTRLRKWAAGKLRQELTLRRMELEKYGLNKAKNWNDDTTDEMIEEKMKGMKMSETITLSPEIMANLPPRLISVYTLWKEGYDLRAMYSKNTFYRHRRGMLEHGIDIAIRQPHEDRTNVVPLIRYLEAVPVTVPDWAHGTDLYFEPRRKAM